jgi:protein O-mannosyl-transferase
MKISKSFAVYAILTIATLAVFTQALKYGFINFDDPIYVLNNQHLNKGISIERIKWAFSSIYAGFWFPLTWLSHMFDCELFDLNPAGHHLSSIILHLINSLLLFTILKKISGALWQSAFTASLFAIHPLHVEPVIWIACRKDLLSTFFMFMTIWAYYHYTNHPGLKNYLIVVLFFIMGLMSKPMIMTLPFVLLLLDYWPLQRLIKKKNIADTDSIFSLPTHFFLKNRDNILLILEKLPLILLSLASGILVYYSEHQYGALGSSDSFPFHARLANSFVTYMEYIVKMIWPQNLSILYPIGGMHSLIKIFSSLFIFLLITFFVIKIARTHRYLTVGWLWYIITLIPVIGLIQIGVHSMADRYAYIPLTGIFIMISWGITDIMKKLQHKTFFLSLAGIPYFIFLITASYLQSQYWKDDITLFRHAVDTTSNNYIAYNNLGIALENNKEFNKALLNFSKALLIRPNSLEINNNIGTVYARLGKFDEAASHFNRVLRLDPNSAGTNFNLGLCYMQKGALKIAALCFERVIEIQPNYPDAHFNLGLLLYMQGKYKEAAAYFTKELYLRPGYIEAQRNLEICLQKIQK